MAWLFKRKGMANQYSCLNGPLNHDGLSFSRRRASKPGKNLHRDICARDYTFSSPLDLLLA